MNSLAKNRYPLAQAALLAGVFCGAFLASRASACPYSIRDSAFIGSDAVPPYRLAFLVDGKTPQKDKLTEWVATGAVAWLADANIVAEVLHMDGDDTPGIRQSLGEEFPSHDDLPAAVLVSPRGEALLLPSAKPGKFSLSAVMTMLAASVDSPARSEIREHVVNSWCVVLLVEGQDRTQNEQAKKVIQAAAEKITGTTTELGKVVATGPHLITVSANDPKERILLWSLGGKKGSGAFYPQGPKGALHKRLPTPFSPRVAVLVGRGELRGPVFESEQITESTLFQTFEMLGRSCSCTTDPMWLSGPAVPMQWDSDMREAVQAELGFDPNDPQAIDSVRDVLAGGGTPLRTGNPAIGPGIGYRELSFEAITNPARDAATAEDLSPAENPSLAEPQLVASGDSPSPQEETPLAAAQPPPVRTGRLVLAAIAGSAFVILTAATLVILKKTRNA